MMALSNLCKGGVIGMTAGAPKESITYKPCNGGKCQHISGLHDHTFHTVDNVSQFDLPCKSEYCKKN